MRNLFDFGALEDGELLNNDKLGRGVPGYIHLRKLVDGFKITPILILLVLLFVK